MLKEFDFIVGKEIDYKIVFLILKKLWIVCTENYNSSQPHLNGDLHYRLNFDPSMPDE